jgi:hypothetical protein
MARPGRAQSRLIAKTLPKSLIRAQAAGEICANLGGDEIATRITQEGFASGAFRTLEVYGVDPNGYARALVRHTVSSHEDGDDRIHIDADDGRSMIERLDGGLAAAIARTKADFQRKCLRAEIRYYFTPEIDSDPARRRAVQNRLGTYDSPIPTTAPGSTLARVGKLTLGKDPHQSTEFYRGKKQHT